MSSSCSGNLFGPKSQFIKTNGGDLIATEGASTREKMMLSDLRIPYKQIAKGRVILKPGQTAYPLNHLGLGDNATFLSLKVTYDPKSKFEFDNYIKWNYYDDSSWEQKTKNIFLAHYQVKAQTGYFASRPDEAEHLNRFQVRT